jgi:hypothetical protein
MGAEAEDLMPCAAQHQADLGLQRESAVVIR